MASRENSKREMTIVSQNSAFYTPTEREIGKIHVFILFRRPIRYIRRGRNGEREGKKEEKKEREKLGKIIGSRLFVRLFVVYVEEGTERERERGGEKLGKMIVLLLSVFPVHRLTSKKIFIKFDQKLSGSKNLNLLSVCQNC